MAAWWLMDNGDVHHYYGFIYSFQSSRPSHEIAFIGFRPHALTARRNPHLLFVHCSILTMKSYVYVTRLWNSVSSSIYLSVDTAWMQGWLKPRGRPIPACVSTLWQRSIKCWITEPRLSYRIKLMSTLVMDLSRCGSPWTPWCIIEMAFVGWPRHGFGGFASSLEDILISLT